MAELDRLRWQCRRGMLELDLVLTKFLDRHAVTLSAADMKVFRRLLDYPDNDLWDLVSGKIPPPDPDAATIIKMFE
jgi:antitoxin CptB